MGQEYTIRRDNEPDLKFHGELLGEISSQELHGIWTTLRVYRMTDGKFVAEEIEHTLWEGEKTRNTATICKNQEEIIAALGTSWLAKQLYSSVGMDEGFWS